MEPYTSISAAYARSLVRRSWTESRKGRYDKLLTEIYQAIEKAAKEGNLNVMFGLADEIADNDVIDLVAAEVIAEGFTVTVIGDFKGLAISWVKE